MKFTPLFSALLMYIGMHSLIAQSTSDYYHYIEFTVSDNQNWNLNTLPINGNVSAPNGVLRIDQLLTIETGNTLVINSDIQLEFGHYGRISIEPEAELVVDGAVITKGCDGYWYGIEVLGREYESQTDIYQGRVHLKNDATIAFAKTAISLIGLDDEFNYEWGTSGGILKAENMTFKNCQTAVQFMEYENHNSSGAEINNVGTIINCSVLVDNAINDVFTEGELIGISLWGVDGVHIGACDFVNNITNKGSSLFNILPSVAIKAVDASFRLGAEYPGLTLPVIPDESLYDRSEISGFEYGIDVSNIDELTSVYIDRTDFYGNRVGAFLKNTKAARLSNSSFSVPSLINIQETYKDISTVGAHFKNSNRYIIEENEFYGTNEGNFGLDNFDAGLVIESSGSLTDDRVYRNGFDKLSYAFMIYGVNGSDNLFGHKGLEFRCNDFGYNSSLGSNTLNYKDIYLFSDAVIDLTQGVISARADQASGNRFKEKSTVNGHIEIANPSLQLEHYYHHEDPYAVPENSDNTKIQTKSTENEYGQDKNESCPGRGPVGPLVYDPYRRVVIEDIRDGYSVLDDNYKSILNGGLKPDILEVLLDDFASTSSIYEKMTLGSPYLSDDILIAAITRQIPMNQWHLTEILIWNGPLSRKVMEVFNQTQPLTPYLASLVYNKDGNSQRHLLELDMKTAREEIAVLEADYIHTTLFDENLDNGYQEIYDLYVDVNTSEALRIKVSVLLHQDDYDEALNILNDYMAVNDDNYGSFKQIDISLQKSGLNWFQMNDVQLETITQIASYTDVFGSGKAQSVLALINDEPINDYSMPIAETPEFRQLNGVGHPFAQRSLMDISPNPATDDLYVTYELPEFYNSAIIEVRNIIGQNIEQVNVGDFRHVYKMDCEVYKTGTYILTLVVDGSNIESKKLNVM